MISGSIILKILNDLQKPICKIQLYIAKFREEVDLSDI